MTTGLVTSSQTMLKDCRAEAISGTRSGNLFGYCGLRDPAKGMTYMHEAYIEKQETRFRTLVRAAGGETMYRIAVKTQRRIAVPDNDFHSVRGSILSAEKVRLKPTPDFHHCDKAPASGSGRTGIALGPMDFGFF